MKTAAKIIACIAWFGFTLLLSFLFFRCVVWLESRAGIFFGMRFWITLVSWFSFVAFMAWLPAWLIKKRDLNSARIAAGTATLLMALLFCTVVCTLVWENLVVGKIFNCTDSLPFNFLNPGDWVLGDYVTVAKINPSDPMDKPDSIKEGWSIPRLWLLWGAFVFASVALSASLTFLSIRSRNPNIARELSP
jgi:asparagine N-glycosylation enzyme membrane subunit Stt3